MKIFVSTNDSRQGNRQRIRQLNLPANIEYPSESSLNQLDASIKKNSALVKRIKLFSECQKSQILSDIDRLNLTKFISEVASSIVEAKFKLCDIPVVIDICTKLNRRYRDFRNHLLEQYAKSFPSAKKRYLNDQFNTQATSSQSSLNYSDVSSNSSLNCSDASQSNLSKIRADLRIFAELILVGVFELKDGFPVLMNLLYYLMKVDKNNHQNAEAILAFCKGCGDEFLGLSGYDRLDSYDGDNSQLGSSTSTYDQLLSPKRQESLRMHMIEYYNSLTKHLNYLHDDYKEFILRNRKSRKSNTDASKESRDELDIKQAEIARFHNILNQLSEVLLLDKPSLPNLDELNEDGFRDVIEKLEIVTNSGRNNQKLLSRRKIAWDDESTRSFYEDLLDLRTLFPNLTLKASSSRKKPIETQIQQPNPSSPNETSTSDGLSKDNDSKSNSPRPGSNTPNKSLDETTDDFSKHLDGSSSDDSCSETPDTFAGANSSMSQAVKNRIQPEQYYNKLSKCVNRDMIDEAAIDFIRFFNTKFGRKKLIKTLFNVQRTRLDLLPFFARLTATLYPYVPSISNDLTACLKQDFRALFWKKDQINIESKVKNVRFIGELVKFNLFSEEDAIICLNMLLSDFTHHHIEMTCNLLETCGRILFNSPLSHHKCRLSLEQMMRKKLLLSVDSKYVTMIENAYYYTNPPEVMKQVIEEPNVNLYVKYLLCDCLSRTTIDKVLDSLKKLDWGDKELAKFVIGCMVESYNLKFFNIRYLAALIAALNKVHPWIATSVIDGVVEDIVLMMEINEIHFNQRRIPMIRYFGELFNYKLSDSSLVFKILYLLITYGVNYNSENNQSANRPIAENNDRNQVEENETITSSSSSSKTPINNLDPPDNLFRIKLVCHLLDTSGQYLTSGTDKKKLDCFILFFQRYYWFKRKIYTGNPFCMAKSGNQFPAPIEFLFNDSILNLKPNFLMASSYNEAVEQLQSVISKMSSGQSSSSSS